MKPEQLYQILQDLAEKFNITVSEKNFRNTGIKVKSGFCRVKDKNLFIIDKHIPIFKKNNILASYLSKMSYEDVYIIPVVRDFLDKFNKTNGNNMEIDSP